MKEKEIQTKAKSLMEKWGKLLSESHSDCSKALLIEGQQSRIHIIESKPQRLDGSFISDKERKKMIEKSKEK